VTISIIICTRDRADSLRMTLQSIASAEIPAGWSAELLVVDNGSTDHTSQVLQNAVCNNLRLRHVMEPTPGQCFARNRGLKEATGDVIVFTDDDVRVPSNWIEGMCRPIADGRCDAVAGGIVFPPHIAHRMSRPPLVLLRAWFASSDYLDPEKPVNMIGANMAFHRRVLSKVRAFDTQLGPGALGFFDEALFSWQMTAAGFRLKGSLDVAVEHHFDTTRLTRDSLLTLARKMGRSRAYIFHHWKQQRSRMIVPRLTWAELQLAWARILDRNGRLAGRLPSIEVIRQEEMRAFCREYLVQRKGPARYAVSGTAEVQAEPASTVCPSPAMANGRGSR